MTAKKHKKRKRKAVRALLAGILTFLILVAAGIISVILIKNILNPDSGNNPGNVPVSVQDNQNEDENGLPSSTDENPEDETQSEDEQSEEMAEYDNSYLSGDVMDEEIENLIGQMTLHEKVCQMIVVTPDGLCGETASVSADEKTGELLAATPVGGICVMGNNISDAEQIRNMISGYQTYAKDNHGIGLFVCTDEEGGVVNRFAGKVGNTKFSPMFSYKDAGTQVAYDNAKTIGSEIAQYGVNLNLAPVADVRTNPENTVIGTRAYSDNPQQAAELVASAVKGFHAGGVICTLKHFPGHGDTVEDTHLASAYSNKTKEELQEAEFLPFIAGIDAGADVVMSAHVTVPSIDDLPSSMSEKVLSVLRDEMNFKGLIMTDSLSMQAVEGKYSYEDIGVKCIQAGNDVLLVHLGMDRIVSGVEAALQNGELSEDRINESVRRILKLKKKYGLIDGMQAD